MSKNLFLIGLFIIILVGGLFYLRGSEDTWLCQNGQWVKHGQPAAAQPTTPCGQGSATTTAPAAMANPASTNCVDKGGQLIMEQNPSGGQYGVCYFSGSRQCEEWAMFRGECPEGGIPVMSYKQPEARYCAITGGLFSKDICTLSDNKKCDAGEYFAGRCPANETNGH